MMEAAPGSFVAAMSRWHDFYMLTGGAAATLMGLLFVAVSFGMGLELQERRDGLNTFVTPTMVHFVDVLVIAAASVSPLPPRVVALLLVVLIVINVVPGLQRVRKLRQYHDEDPFDWRDWLWYLLLPVGCELLLILAAVGLWREQPTALLTMAGALVLLLVAGVRNAWDLVRFLVAKR
jgi:hypothetical protein